MWIVSESLDSVPHCYCCWETQQDQTISNSSGIHFLYGKKITLTVDLNIDPIIVIILSIKMNILAFRSMKNHGS